MYGSLFLLLLTVDRIEDYIGEYNFINSTIFFTYEEYRAKIKNKYIIG